MHIFLNAFLRLYILCFAAAGVWVPLLTVSPKSHLPAQVLQGPYPHPWRALEESPQVSTHHWFPGACCTSWGRWQDRGLYYSALAARGSCSIWWFRYQCHLQHESLTVCCVLQQQQNEMVTRSSHWNWVSSRLLKLPASTRCLGGCELGVYIQCHSTVGTCHILWKSFIFCVTWLGTSFSTSWTFLPYAT